MRQSWRALSELEERIMASLDEHEKRSLERQEASERRAIDREKELEERLSERIGTLGEQLGEVFQAQRDEKLKAEWEAEFMKKMGLPRPQVHVDATVGPSPLASGAGKVLDAVADNIKLIAIMVIVATGGTGAALQALHASESRLPPRETVSTPDTEPYETPDDPVGSGEQSDPVPQL